MGCPICCFQISGFSNYIKEAKVFQIVISHLLKHLKSKVRQIEYPTCETRTLFKILCCISNFLDSFAYFFQRLCIDICWVHVASAACPFTTFTASATIDAAQHLICQNLTVVKRCKLIYRYHNLLV